MDDIHFSRDLLRAVSKGELPVKLLTQLGLKHLMDLCPYCKREIRAWQREMQGSALVEENLDLLPSFKEDGAQPALNAANELQELIALPHVERLRRVRQARTRFRSPALAQLLLATSWERVHGNPEESFCLAELALVVADHSPQMPKVIEFNVLASVALGNACRAAGSLRAADKHFTFARTILKDHAVTDPEILARVDDLEGSLRRDGRQFSRAEELLSRAAMLYGIVGNDAGTARVLIKLASTYYHQGLTHRAIETVRGAVKKIPLPAESRLYLYGRHNLAHYLTEVGRPLEAAGIVAADAKRYREYPDSHTQLHLSWLQSRIAMGLKDYKNAEEALLEAQQGFIGEGLGYDAALVSLDLATLYLRQGRTQELRALVEAATPIFASQDIHREAAAALVLFQDAVEHEALSAKLLQDVVRYLRIARNDPSLRFREPS